jgi:hypothetical protein
LRSGISHGSEIYSLLISGCNNFRISTVTDHEKSKGHLDALQVKHAKDQPEQTEGHKKY